MNILVFNCGSSSLKYKLLAMPSCMELAGGEAQRVGPPTAKPAVIYHRVKGKEQEYQTKMPDHAVAFEKVMELLAQEPELQVDAVGHRLVHGGAIFNQHAVVDDAALENLEDTRELAPLHNPPAITLVRACRQLYPDLPAVMVFDTAYHSTIPEYARTYALPKWMREDMGIRKYGFHGTSHQYVAAEAAKFLGKPIDELNAVSCHLGTGGASLCAIVKGKSVDNTMGHSPLQGLMMSTRCGDLDAAVVMRLLADTHRDYKSVEKLLNKQSGVLGMSGSTADIRDILVRLTQEKSDRVSIDKALQVYAWRIKKYLGAYLTIVEKADAVIFTDTIGETVPLIRREVCSSMDSFGVKIDSSRNNRAKELPADIATEDSAVRVLVIQTNEELAIARYTYGILTNRTGGATAQEGAA